MRGLSSGSRRHHFEEGRRHAVCEPNSVYGTIELVTIQLHLACSDFEHYGLAMTLADFDGSRFVRGKMHMLTITLVILPRF